MAFTRKEIQQRYREKNPVAVKAARAKWYAKNPQNSQQWAKAHPERIRAIKRKHRYGEISRPEPACCEACRIPFSGYHGSCVDHDHKTGVFRGWLCNDCNLALGYLKDSKERIIQLRQYLEMVEALL